MPSKADNVPSEMRLEKRWDWAFTEFATKMGGTAHLRVVFSLLCY